MNVQFVNPEAAEDQQQQINDLQIAASGMSQSDIHFALGLTKPMERKFSTKAKIGLGLGGALGLVGLLSVGVLAENKLSVAEKVAGGLTGAYRAVTGLFGGGATAA